MLIEILCKAILQKTMIVNPRRKIKIHRYTEMTKQVSQLLVYLVQMVQMVQMEKDHYVKIVEPNLESNNHFHVMH